MLEVINILPFFVSLSMRLSFATHPDKAIFSTFVNRYQELGELAELYQTCAEFGAALPPPTRRTPGRAGRSWTLDLT